MTSSDGWQSAFEAELQGLSPDAGAGFVGVSRLPARSANGRSLQLLQTIESEIIPRLVLSQRAIGQTPAAVTALAWAPDEGMVAEFANLVVAEDVGVAAARIEGLRAKGVPIETVYLDLLAPTARYLGELWSADLCDFTAVTLGCLRLQQLLHELSPAFFREVEHHEHRRRVLLVPVPGEQHTFGLYMVAEFFRRAGWDVWSGCMPSRELAQLVSREAFTLVGFSLSADSRLDTLASNIRAVRRASCNRGIGVLVGGPVFVGHPELVSLVGADATAHDARQATQQAQNTLALLSRSS
jgi:methanogenic corrinoid protein MtbC1